MKLDEKLIGIRIMTKRKEKGLSQEELSEIIGYSKNHISILNVGSMFQQPLLFLKFATLLGKLRIII